MVPPRTLPRSSNTRSCFQLALKWIDQCLADHPLCRIQSTSLPTRVVAVGKEGEDPRILVSENLRGLWVCLSHCWGSERPVSTTSKNLEERRMRLSWNDLPPLFQNAITITRKLGFQYIWIDSLCILQDLASEWRSESLKMDQYYSNCVVNISASASPDSSVGIFTSANYLRDIYKPVASATYHSKNYDIEGALHLGNSEWIDHREAPLYKRAWVLQETILSPRVLFFDMDKIRRDCNTLACNEIMPVFPSQEIVLREKFLAVRTIFATPFKSMKKEDHDEYNLLSWWYLILDEYLHRDITYSDDLLPAFSGVAKEFAKHTDMTYLCGLWLEDFAVGLMWRSSGGKVESNFASAPPSWSWATLNGPRPNKGYRICNPGEKNLREHAELVGHSVVTADDNIFGQVISASLTIRGRYEYLRRLKPTKIVSDNRDIFDVRSYISEEFPFSIRCTLDKRQDANIGVKQLLLALRSDAIYLEIAKRQDDQGRHRIEALILEPSMESDTYKRVGTAYMYGPDCEHWCWEHRLVVII